MTTQTRWLVTALDEGRKVEARRDRAELVQERMFLAARRNESLAAGRGVVVLAALVLGVVGVVVTIANPLPTVAAWVGVACFWAGAVLFTRATRRTGGAS